MDQRAGVAAHAGLAKHAGGHRHGALGCTGGAASRGDTGLGVLTWRALNGVLSISFGSMIDSLPKPGKIQRFKLRTGGLITDACGAHATALQNDPGLS